MSTSSRDWKIGEEWIWVQTSMKEEPLRPSRASPLHNEDFRVIRGRNANEPRHPLQTINSPHRPGALLCPSKFVRQPPNAPLKGLKDDLPILWGPAHGPLGRNDGSPEAHVNGLENVVEGDEEVGKG